MGDNIKIDRKEKVRMKCIEYTHRTECVELVWR